MLVTNGREALKRIEIEAFDVVITDWYMPEMSGIDFMRTMRGNDATRNIPIVMVTANASGSDVAEAASLGVNGYVLKPFTADALRDRIDAACAAVRHAADPQPLPA